MVLFLHDGSRLRHDSDDPIKALVYFRSSRPTTRNEQCWISNSIVAMSESVSAFAPPRTLRLTDFRFAVHRSSNHVTLSLGSSGGDDDIATELTRALETIEFRFGSVAAMLERRFNDDSPPFDLFEFAVARRLAARLSTHCAENLRALLTAERCRESAPRCIAGVVITNSNLVLNSTFSARLTAAITSASLDLNVADDGRAETQVHPSASDRAKLFSSDDRQRAMRLVVFRHQSSDVIMSLLCSDSDDLMEAERCFRCWCRNFVRE